MEKIYSYEYDAFFNSETGEWLEGLCYDVDCAFCKERPVNAFDKNIFVLSQPNKIDKKT